MRHPSRLDLIEGLNDDLARAYASIIQGRTFASLLRGTDRLALRPLFTDVPVARSTPHGRVGDLAATPSDQIPHTEMVGVTWPDDDRDAGSCS